MRQLSKPLRHLAQRRFFFSVSTPALCSSNKPDTGVGHAPNLKSSSLFKSLTPDEIRLELDAKQAELEALLRKQTGEDSDSKVAQAEKEEREQAIRDEQATNETQETRGTRIVDESAASTETGAVGSSSFTEKPPESSNDTASGEFGKDQKPLWPDCDTIEDIMDEEKYGAPGELPPVSDEEHVKLAYRALAYGTVIAVVMTGAFMTIMAYMLGFNSWEDVKNHLEGNEKRRMEHLAKLAAEHPDDPDALLAAEKKIKHFELDITSPTTLPQQVEELMGLIQQLAEEQEAEEDAEAEAEAQQNLKK